MSKPALIVQGLTPSFHAEELRKILSQSKCKHFLASVAFVLKDGVDSIASQLQAAAQISTFYIGIRNDITSIQAVKRLLELGVKVFAVDTGARHLIFHPKLFLLERDQHATLIIGSANLTFSGLHNNIEASVVLGLDLTKKDDRGLVKELTETFEKLPTRFPGNVLRIKDAAAAEKLFEEGRLTDEDIVPAPTGAGTLRKTPRDSVEIMNLPRHTPPARKIYSKKNKKEPPTKTAENSSLLSPTDEFVLVWTSKGLRERDLGVPSGANTNPTGSMLWKVGQLSGIDQRHYFRDVVFKDLQWKADPHSPHLERAEGSFEIVIKGINLGKHILKLSHNTDQESRSYIQHNSITHLHWGAISKLVGKRDLIGRILTLSRRDSQPPAFLIEID
jgi:HKD family nuclease